MASSQFGLESTAGEESLDHNSDVESDDENDDTADWKFFLISEVKKRSFFYDSGNPSKHDSTKTRNAWDDIEKLIKYRFPDFKGYPKSIWKNLRDTYLRRKKPKIPPGGSAGGKKKKQKPWRFEQEMVFLDAFMKPRKTVCNVRRGMEMVSQEISNASAEPNLTIQFTGPLNESNAPSYVVVNEGDNLIDPSLHSAASKSTVAYSPDSTATTVKRTASQKRSSSSDIDDQIRGFISDRSEAPKKDEWYHFGMQVAECLRQCSDKNPREARHVRIEIMQILDNVVMELENQ